MSVVKLNARRPGPERFTWVCGRCDVESKDAYPTAIKALEGMKEHLCGYGIVVGFPDGTVTCDERGRPIDAHSIPNEVR